MAQLSSKPILLALAALFISESALAQAVNAATDHRDYKDPKSHERFAKRRSTVAAWQIKNLKEGALVVKLRTNRMLVDELKKRGDDHLAEKARLEQAAINVNTVRAFVNNYNFSKVYFVYSHSADSLLSGTRSGIFLDSNLKLVPSLKMNENFYLVAETDYIYNSSIGFVPEDSARFVTEAGNPSASEYPFVIKNKYGHQLKGPFPYSTNRTAFVKKMPTTDIVVDGKRLNYTVTGSMSGFRTGPATSNYSVNGKTYELTIPRAMTYDALSQHVEELNSNLNGFYRGYGDLPEKSGAYQDAKPFMY
jgi:hypothetical protein